MKTVTDWYNIFIEAETMEEDYEVIQKIMDESWDDALDKVLTEFRVALQTAIAKAKPNMDKIKNVDKFLEEGK
jgi:hypothetical protein